MSSSLFAFRPSRPSPASRCSAKSAQNLISFFSFIGCDDIYRLPLHTAVHYLFWLHQWLIMISPFQLSDLSLIGLSSHRGFRRFKEAASLSSRGSRCLHTVKRDAVRCSLQTLIDRFRRSAHSQGTFCLSTMILIYLVHEKPPTTL